MATQLAAVPEYVVETPVTRNSITGRVTQAMRYWLLSLADRVNTTPNRVASATAVSQSAWCRRINLSDGFFDFIGVARFV